MAASGRPLTLGSDAPSPPVEQPDRRLRRNQRILCSRTFEDIFNAGIRFPGQGMVLWVQRTEGGSCRLGVVAARRSFRRAVDRNRAKRRLREAFRRNRFRLCAGADVVLLARHAVLQMNFAALEQDLMRLAAKAGLVPGRRAAAKA
jgi:ribonuclease P protein component